MLEHKRLADQHKDKHGALGTVSMMLATVIAGAVSLSGGVGATSGNATLSSTARDIIPGDLDDDGDVDIDDFELFAGCMHGPDVSETSPPCARGHFDVDLDIDLYDFAGFQDAFLETGG